MSDDGGMEAILERYEQPARRGRLPTPPALSASATNPRCGDVVTMFAAIEGERLMRVTFEGSGCTISVAAADLVAEMAEGQSLATVRMLRLSDVLEQLGVLVRTRLDCAALGLNTLQRAIAGA